MIKSYCCVRRKWLRLGSQTEAIFSFYNSNPSLRLRFILEKSTRANESVESLRNNAPKLSNTKSEITNPMLASPSMTVPIGIYERNIMSPMNIIASSTQTIVNGYEIRIPTSKKTATKIIKP